MVPLLVDGAHAFAHFPFTAAGHNAIAEALTDEIDLFADAMEQVIARGLRG
jgi:hypothetical protein